jgi:hypothetical protein
VKTTTHFIDIARADLASTRIRVDGEDKGALEELIRKAEAHDRTMALRNRILGTEPIRHG